jgi:hypothetical protein
VLHAKNLEEKDIERHAGFFVTTPLRTILDSAESDLSPEHLIKALRDALTRGSIRRKQLEEEILSPLGRQRLNEAMAALARD